MFTYCPNCGANLKGEERPMNNHIADIDKMDDLISIRQAIDIVMFECGKWIGLAKEISKQLKKLPSTQPIIRCKDCKYRDENWRRVSVRWLPCMDVRTGSNWYCGSAERGEHDE